MVLVKVSLYFFYIVLLSNVDILVADADFGYVGGKPGHVDLYVGKTVIRRAIPNEIACDELVQLIKENGRWQEPPVQEAELSTSEELITA